MNPTSERAVAAEPPDVAEGRAAAAAGRALPTEGRRALIATALGAAVGLLVSLFSKRDEDAAN